MGQQQTFAGLAWKDKGKVTRRERFLAEMNAVIPWATLLGREGHAPGVSVTVTTGDRSLPLCSYPSYPHFRGGEPGELIHVLTPTISPSFRVGGLTCG